MPKRFVSIWFPHLKTDWFTLRQPTLNQVPFVLSAPDHGRMIITGVNSLGQSQGIEAGMAVADARAIIPSLQVFDDSPALELKVLSGFAEWLIRYTPLVGIDLPDGLILDVTGCTHLRGGEKEYLTEIIKRISAFGYNIRACMADTIGAAWGLTRFGNGSEIISTGKHKASLLNLPPAALRLEVSSLERLQKLGLHQVRHLLDMPRAVLQRRFGPQLVQRIHQALGMEQEGFQPVLPVEPYQERLPCLEPIVTANGIAIALERLLETLCLRLQQEQKGLRVAVFKGCRVDGKVQKIEIGTNRASHNAEHIFKLFEFRLSSIEPALGIELFTLDALKIDELSPMQEQLWEGTCDLGHPGLSNLIDRITNRIGVNSIRRYLPDEHYWPERSIKTAGSLDEKPAIPWRTDKQRPLQLLPIPEPVEVTAPVPDYPPMLFRYKGKLYRIKKADGPERIEREWWLEEGQHRDYYIVEDEEGYRYWLFRSGHYTGEKTWQWFLHGFFS